MTFIISNSFTLEFIFKKDAINWLLLNGWTSVDKDWKYWENTTNERAIIHHEQK